MTHEGRDHTIDLDLISIEKIGVTIDFANEIVPEPEDEEDVDFFINKRCKAGIARTYTERYQDSPMVLEKSDRKKVEEIDRLMSEAIAAGKIDDRDVVKEKLRQLLAFFK